MQQQRQCSYEDLDWLFDSLFLCSEVEDFSRMRRRSLLLTELYELTESIVDKYGTKKQKEVWNLEKIGKKQVDIGVILNPRHPIDQAAISDRLRNLHRKIRKYVFSSARGQRILRHLAEIVDSESPAKKAAEIKQAEHTTRSKAAKKAHLTRSTDHLLV